MGKKIRFCEEQLICMSGFEILNEDFQASLDSAQSEKSNTIGVPKVINILFKFFAFLIIRLNLFFK